MVADDTAVGTAIAPEWIVCKASTRTVVDGVVVCPLGLFSPWAHCLGCHFLEGAEGDRDPERSCSVEPTAAPAEAHLASRTAACGELIIELL